MRPFKMISAAMAIGLLSAIPMRGQEWERTTPYYEDDA